MTAVLAPVTESPARRHPWAGGREPRSTARRIAGTVLGTIVADLLVIVAVVAFSGLVLGPNVLGYRTETMLTGSMAPAIKPGDVLVIATKPATELAVGDQISYTIPVQDHRVVTHRVTEVDNSDGEITFRTKGDANPDPDPWTATVQGRTVWTVRGVVPFAGTALRALRHPALSAVLRWWVPSLLSAVALLQIWRRKPASEDATVPGPRRRPRRRGPRGQLPPGKHRAA
jgi:signal peptidase